MWDEFGSTISKISWADSHLIALQAELEEWAQKVPTIVFLEPSDDARQYSVQAEIVHHPELERWSLMAGDCVHSARCALDHLVYALAIQEGRVDPPADAKRLQFPITQSREEFDVQMQRIKSLSPESQALIEAAQPYNQSRSDSPAVLTVLNEFDNIDKHRLLNTATHRAGGVRVVFDEEPLVRRSLKLIDAPIEGRTEVASLTFDSPVPELKCRVLMSCAVVVTHSPGPNGGVASPLKVVLREIVNEVKRIAETILESRRLGP
jgi:hypothetical protein